MLVDGEYNCPSTHLIDLTSLADLASLSPPKFRRLLGRCVDKGTFRIKAIRANWRAYHETFLIPRTVCAGRVIAPRWKVWRAWFWLSAEHVHSCQDTSEYKKYRLHFQTFMAIPVYLSIIFVPCPINSWPSYRTNNVRWKIINTEKENISKWINYLSVGFTSETVRENNVNFEIVAQRKRFSQHRTHPRWIWDGSTA